VGWASEATPVSLREILLEEIGGRATAKGSAADDAGASTYCSWGRDAMASEKPKGRSIYEIQEQEESENAKHKEEQEIWEIEAMFAALEVADRTDAQAKEVSKVKSPKVSKGKKVAPAASSTTSGAKEAEKECAARSQNDAEAVHGGGRSGRGAREHAGRGRHKPGTAADGSWVANGWNGWDKRGCRASWSSGGWEDGAWSSADWREGASGVTGDKKSRWVAKDAATTGAANPKAAEESIDGNEAQAA